MAESQRYLAPWSYESREQVERIISKMSSNVNGTKNVRPAQLPDGRWSYTYERN